MYWRNDLVFRVVSEWSSRYNPWGPTSLPTLESLRTPPLCPATAPTTSVAAAGDAGPAVTLGDWVVSRASSSRQRRAHGGRRLHLLQPHLPEGSRRKKVIIVYEEMQLGSLLLIISVLQL